MYRDVVDALAGRVDPGITSPGDLKAGPGWTLRSRMPTTKPCRRPSTGVAGPSPSRAAAPAAGRAAGAKRWRGRRRPQQGSLKDRVAPNMAPEPNPLLETKFRVILLDFLGCGMSDKPSNERVCSTTMQIRVLADLFAKLQLEKVVLVMHDAASVIGQCCLPSIYHRVDSVVLLPRTSGCRPSRSEYRSGAPAASRGPATPRPAPTWRRRRGTLGGFLRFTGAVQHPSEIVRIWIPEGAMVKPGRAGQRHLQLQAEAKQQPEAGAGRPRCLARGGHRSQCRDERRCGRAATPARAEAAGRGPVRHALPRRGPPAHAPQVAGGDLLRGGGQAHSHAARPRAGWLRNHYVKPVLALFGDQDLFLDVQDRTAGIKLVNQVFFSSPDVGVHVIREGGSCSKRTRPPYRQLRHFTEEQAAQTNPRLRRAAADFHAFSM